MQTKGQNDGRIADWGRLKKIKKANWNRDLKRVCRKIKKKDFNRMSKFEYEELKSSEELVKNSEELVKNSEEFFEVEYEEVEWDTPPQSPTSSRAELESLAKTIAEA